MAHATYKYHHLPQHSTTIGYRINDNDGTVSVAFAYTNPNDSYNKSIGRKIVEGRIVKGGYHKNGTPRSITVALDTIGSTRYREITDFIKKHYL